MIFLFEFFKKKNKNYSQKGFTLIELLVVVAIISLLSSIVFASLGSARAKARDARRLTDVRQIRLALELYLNEYGFYPASGGAVQPNGGWSHSAEPVSWGPGSTLQTAITPFLSRLPVDPVNYATPTTWLTSPNVYSYSYHNFSTAYGCNNRTYMLVYKLENGASTVSPGFTACDGTSFQYNGGAMNTSNANGIITLGGNGF